MCICLREHERNKFLTIYLLCHASSYSINGKSFHTSCLPPNPLSHGICLENGKLASTLLFSQCFMWHCRLHYSRVRHASTGTVPNKHSNWFFVGKPANSKSLFGTFRCKQAIIFQLWSIFFSPCGPEWDACWVMGFFQWSTCCSFKYKLFQQCNKRSSVSNWSVINSDADHLFGNIETLLESIYTNS